MNPKGLMIDLTTPWLLLSQEAQGPHRSSEKQYQTDKILIQTVLINQIWKYLKNLDFKNFFSTFFFSYEHLIKNEYF